MPLRLRFIRFLGVRWKMILRIPLCTEAVQVLLQAFWMQVIHAELLTMRELLDANSSSKQ